MKTRIIVVAALLGLASCQNNHQQSSNIQNAMETQAKEIREIKDRLALKELVDVFSNLSDEKKVTEQLELFTEDAEVTSLTGGQVISSFRGKKEIGDAFSGFLAHFHSVYHINGQHTVEIDGDSARGIHYCQVVLIGKQDGKDIGRFSGIRYNDEYVKINGKWFIKKRASNFIYNDIREVK